METNREMVRVTHGKEGDPAVLAANDFAAEVLRLSKRNFDGAPNGPITVEYLGVDGRVQWQAHHRDYAGLVSLARELLQQL